METAVGAIATILFTKFLEKSGEKLAEGLSTQASGALAKIAGNNPKAATLLESGNPAVIDAEVVEVVERQAQTDPELAKMLADMAAIADAELGAGDKAKLQAIASGLNLGNVGVLAMGGTVTIQNQHIYPQPQANEPKTKPVTSSTNMRREQNQRRIEALREEIELEQKQWEATLSFSQRKQLERSIDVKLQELEELEKGL